MTIIKIFLIRQLTILRYVNGFEYLWSLIGFPRSVCKVKIGKEQIYVRRHTLDLYIAATSLQGEFRPIGKIFDEQFSGTIVDAGGYIGTAALALSNLYPNAKIISLEPSEENYALLEMNTARAKNIVPIKAALVSTNNKNSTLSDRGTGQCGYTLVESPLDRDISRLHEVAVLNLLSEEIHYESIDFLKCDIEGAECDILEYDCQYLTKIPYIFIELHDRIDDRCSPLFEKFSVDRHTILAGKEKFLSIKGN